MIPQEITNRGLQPAKTEVIVRILYHWTRKVMGTRISTLGKAVHLRSARVGKPEKLGCFVEALARRIIDGGAEHGMIEFRAHMNKHRVTPAHDEGDVWLE